MTTTSLRQPWLANPAKEVLLILAPAFLPVLAIVLFQDYFSSQHEVTTLWWVVLVLCIDVSHVYSTLFRLYWDKPTFRQYKRLLIIIPVAAFIAGFILHLYSTGLFWRVLAYVAVFHFIRQQYGFMRLYSRQETPDKTGRIIDTLAIYNATLYPLLYWHIHLTDSLSWFVAGDFIPLPLEAAAPYAQYTFLAILALYTVKELVLSVRRKFFNVPKNMIVYGTYCSWYAGIVLFEGDLIFTLLNVVAHGIPYMGLIWIYGEKRAATTGFSFSWRGVLIFTGVLLLLSYLEETIWSVFVWKDHLAVFPLLTGHSPLQDQVLLSALVALLILPQTTHYVLDGFIWRFSKDRHARV